MTRILTPAERETLNAAAEIIAGCLVEGSSFNAYFAYFGGSRLSESADYFDSSQPRAGKDRLHSFYGGMLADRLQLSLNAEAALPSPEEAAAARRAELLAELAQMERAA
jgi:hypothetical protein